MGTWPLLFLILFLIVTFIILGVFIFRRTSRDKKYRLSLPQITQPITDTISLNLIDDKPDIHLPDRLEILMEERKRIAAATNRVGIALPGLVSEIKHNLSVAMNPRSGKMEPFQTVYWDRSQLGTDSMVSLYQEELVQAYTDIRLANIIVWLSVDLNHVSREMEASYFELCEKIAERLQKIASA